MTKAALPSLKQNIFKNSLKIKKRSQFFYFMVSGTHSMFGFLEVNGLATEASALDKEIPELAKLS